MDKSKSACKKPLDNSILNKVFAYIYPITIALYSLCRVNKGLDITDTAYNYSNFRFVDELDDMWYFSTFLSNILGNIFTFLPGGRTMLGLNIYTGLIKTGILLLAFFFLTKRVKLNKHLTFVGIMMAAGLNWCPTAVLYNYLSYLFLLVGVIFIYEAEMSESLKRENIFFLLAGLVLGMNVFVRLPNLCEAALIVAVWYMCIIRKESFLTLLRKTGVCLGGYVTAFLLCVLLAVMTRGFSAYVRGITQMLAGGGDSTSQYTPKGMIFTAFSGYIGIKYWAFFAALALALVAVVSWTYSKFIEGKIKNEKTLKLMEIAKYTLAVLAFIFTIFKFRRTGLYTDAFYEYSSMYGINVIVLIISIGCLLILAFNRKVDEKKRLLAMACLIVIAVTPLGSNNGMYSVLNNLYLILPLMLSCLAGSNKEINWLKPVQLTAGLIVAVGLLHSILFGLNFSFRDGGGEKINCRVENNEILKGMKTISSNAEYLTQVSEVWKNGYEGSRVLVFGNAAGLSFYLNARPAISTVWPSLASFSLDKFENEMKFLRLLKQEKGIEPPVIILGKDGMDAYLARVAGDTSNIEAILGKTYIKKLEILYEFLNNYNYSGIYYCDTFWVFAPGET